LDDIEGEEKSMRIDVCEFFERVDVCELSPSSYPMLPKQIEITTETRDGKNKI
jgi:hypothetical protein